MSSVGGGAIPPLHVSVVISATGAGAAAGAMRSTTGALNAMAGQFTRSQVPIRQMGDAMRQTSSLINYTMIMPLAMLGGAAIQASRNFEKSMKKIQGLVGISGKEVQSFSKSILGMAADTARAPLELADAMYFISSAGIKGAEAIDVLNQAARAAAAGLGETKVVADALTSVINAYGEGNYTAATAADILTAAVKEGKVEADQLAPSLGKVLPIAATFGATFQDVSAGMASLTRTGTTAGTAAIYLRQVMSQLLKPAKAAKEELYAAGTSAEEVRKNVQENGLLDALSMLNAKLGGTDTTVAVSGLTKVFGNVRALQAVLSLLGPNLEENRKIFDAVGGSAGDAAEAFRVYSETADYKFKAALASSQTALIGLGQALMPVASGLMQMGQVLTGAASAIFRLGQGSGFLSRIFSGLFKIIGSVGFAFFIGAKMANGMFRTWSSMVRLGGHLQTTIRGMTQGIRLGGQAAQVSSKAFGGLTMTVDQEAGALNQLTAAENTNTLSTKRALEIAAENNGSLVEKRFLTMAAKQATDLDRISTDEATIAIMNAGTATQAFGTKLMVMLPEIMMVGMLIATVASMFKIGPFGGKTDGLDKTNKSLSDMTTFLGDAVKMDQVDVSLNLKQNKLNFTGGALDADTKKQIEDELATDVQDAVKKIGKRAPGSEEAAAYAGSVIKRMTGLTEESKKSLMLWFQDSLSITPAMIAKAMASLVPFGQGVAEVADNARNILETGLQKDMGKITVSTGGVTSMKVDVRDAFQEILTNTKTDVTDVNAVFDTLFSSSGMGNNIAETIQVSKAVIQSLGTDLSNSFASTHDMGTFLYTLNQVDNSIKSSKLNTDQQKFAMVSFTQAAFSGLTKIGGLEKENSGSFAKMFGDKGNQDGIKAFFQELGVEEDAAKQITTELATAYGGLKNATPLQEFEVFNTVLQNHIDATAGSITETEQQKMAVMELADTFSTGLNPAIQALKDEYDMATGAIKNFEEGQKAVLGLSNDFIGIQVDLGDAIRDVKKALGEAGTGGLDPYSEKGGVAITKLQKYRDAILDTANAEAMDPSKGLGVAAATITAGYENIVQQMIAGGKMTQAQAKATLDSIGFNVAELQGTLVGAGGFTGPNGEADAGLLTKISEGINTNALDAANSAAPGMEAFNNALFQTIKDFWGIKSPSLLAKEKIGKPITQGILLGMSEGYSAKDVVAGMTDFGFNSGKGFSLGMSKGLGASDVAIATEATRLAAIATYYTSGNGSKGGTSGSTTPGTGADAVAAAAAAKASADALAAAFTGAGTSSSGGDKKIETPEQKKMQAVLDKFGKYSTAFSSMIDKITKDAASALGTIGSYINAQLSLGNAMLARQKLVIEQMGYAAATAKAERDKAFSATKVGKNMGADVTDYELSRIEELQTAYEEASRAYAMKRGTFGAMVDAEQALLEARASASEVSPDAIKAETNLMDAKQDEKNKTLELAKATFDIVKAQEEQVAAAIDLAVNMKQATDMFNQFALQSIPNTITGINDLGLGLTDPKGAFQIALHGLGETVFGYIKSAAQEAMDTSATKFITPAIVTNPLDTPPPEPVVPAQTLTQDHTPAVPAAGTTPGATYNPVGQGAVKSKYGVPSNGLVNLFRSNPGAVRPEDIERFQLWNYMASGGIVTKATRAIIGESGPEAVIPLQGYSTQIALEKLFKVNQSDSMNSSYGSGSTVNIVVNNPIAETSEESIARRMKALSTAGLFG